MGSSSSSGRAAECFLWFDGADGGIRTPFGRILNVNSSAFTNFLAASTQLVFPNIDNTSKRIADTTRYGARVLNRDENQGRGSSSGGCRMGGTVLWPFDGPSGGIGPFGRIPNVNLSTFLMFLVASAQLVLPNPNKSSKRIVETTTEPLPAEPCPSNPSDSSSPLPRVIRPARHQNSSYICPLCRTRAAVWEIPDLRLPYSRRSEVLMCLKINM